MGRWSFRSVMACEIVNVFSHGGDFNMRGGISLWVLCGFLVMAVENAVFE